MSGLGESRRNPLYQRRPARDAAIRPPGLVFQDTNLRNHGARLARRDRERHCYRFDLPDRSVVFSGDRERSDAITRLAAGVDQLIHEPMYLPALDRLLAKNANAPTLRANRLASHTLVKDCGRVAREAGVRKLVLSHHAPGDDPSATDDLWIAEAARQFGGETVVARDGMEV